MRILGLGVLAAVVLLGQDALPDWVMHLSRAKIHLKDTLEKIPNYVCREKITRYRQTAHESRFNKLDVLELDVAEVDNKELLASPGALGFQETELTYFSREGILGTGTFSALPQAIFVSNTARIRPHQAAEGASGQLSFDYDIPQFLSGFQLSNGSGKATVGHRGAVWLDPETYDLIRAEDHAVDVPITLGMTAVDSTVQYARMRIGDTETVLPRAATNTVDRVNGDIMRNEIEFTGCRAYTSESTIHFGDMDVQPPPAKKK